MARATHDAVDPTPPPRRARSTGVAAQRGSPRPEAGPAARTPGIRVLCVDDHAVLIEGLKAHFAIEGRIEVVGRLPTAERLLSEVARLRPDIVLLDIEMPGPDAFDMADRLRHMHPAVRVIFLSAHIRDSHIAASFKAGAGGYFSKSDELDDIVAGIRAVAGGAGGSFVLGPKVSERCRSVHAQGEMGGGRGPARGASGANTEDSPATLLESLTAREAEILRLVGKGLSRTQIAADLCRSAKTIDGHQKRMMKKLGITSRADLIRFAIREGLAQA